MFSAAILFVKGISSILDERSFIPEKYLNLGFGFREQEEAAYLVYWGM